jgi:hypothetical protein
MQHKALKMLEFQHQHAPGLYLHAAIIFYQLD